MDAEVKVLLIGALTLMDIDVFIKECNRRIDNYKEEHNVPEAIDIIKVAILTAKKVQRAERITEIELSAMASVYIALCEEESHNYAIGVAMKEKLT